LVHYILIPIGIRTDSIMSTPIKQFFIHRLDIFNWVCFMVILLTVEYISYCIAPDNILVFIGTISVIMFLICLWFTYLRSPRRTYRPKWIKTYLEFMGYHIYSETELKIIFQCNIVVCIITIVMLVECIYFSYRP